jgi:hypothetical protein
VDLKSLKSRYKESLPKINYPCQGNWLIVYSILGLTFIRNYQKN